MIPKHDGQIYLNLDSSCVCVKKTDKQDFHATQITQKFPRKHELPNIILNSNLWLEIRTFFKSLTRGNRNRA